MATRPSTDFFTDTCAVFAFANNATETTPGSGAPEVLTAAGAGDNTAITGNTINRDTFGMPQSALLVVSAYLNLADTKGLELALEIQESSDGSTWDTAEALLANTEVKTASGAFTDGVVYTIPVYLGDRKQYIRFNCTPDLTNTSTDVATVHGTVILAGSHNPAKLTAHVDTDTFYG